MKNTTALSFGEKIKQIRIAKGLKQEELAKAINAGRTFVSRLESGQAEYDDHMLTAIREFYGIEHAPLFDHELEDYRNRLWIWHDLVDTNRLSEAKDMQTKLSPILGLPYEHDLNLVYMMIDAKVLLKEGSFVEGEERLNTVKEHLDSACVEALHLYHRNMGFLCLVRRDSRASLKHFLKSIKYVTDNLKPDAGIFINLGMIYHNLGKPWQAILHLEHIKASQNFDRSYRYESAINFVLATCYMHIGKNGKSEELFNNALMQAKRINNESDTGTALNNLASLYRRKGDYKASLKACDQALIFLKNDPYRYANALLTKASCLLSMKDFAKCEEVITLGMDLVKDDKKLTISFETLRYLTALDDSRSIEYLETFAIPHFRTIAADDGGGMYEALDICNTLEAHYRKKRRQKNAQAIAAIARDILLEMHHGDVEFE